MKILTDHQLSLIKWESYNKGFDAAHEMREKVLKVWFENVCTVLRRQLLELENNTWDKDRVKLMRQYLDERIDNFGVFGG